MAQKGTLHKLKAGLQTTANGAGSTVTTLNVDDAIFLAEHVGATITDGTFSTTIATVTDADTVELTAAQSWADAATISLEEVVIQDQMAINIPRGQAVIKTTSKDDLGNQTRRLRS